jgi:hypothetical protein
VITVALVRPDGTESADRPPWTGTYLDLDSRQIRGDDVRFWPEPGRYVGYQDGRLLFGAPLFDDYRPIIVGPQRRHWWQRRPRRNTGDTVTLADLHIGLIPGPDNSTRLGRTTSA